MNKKWFTIVVGGAAALGFHAVAAERFVSPEQILTEFATNSIAAREEAYRCVVGKAENLTVRNAQSTLQALRTMAEALDRIEEYDAICERGTGTGSEPVRFACVSALLLSPSVTVADVSNIERAEQFMRDAEALTPAHRIELARLVADVRNRIRDAKGAIKILNEVISWSDVDPVLVFPLRLRKLDFCKWEKMDDELEREARSILADKACPARTRVFAFLALTDLASRHKDPKAVFDLIEEMVRTADFIPRGLAGFLIKAGADEAMLNAMVMAFRRRLARVPFSGANIFEDEIENVQPEIIEILSRLRRWEEALAECRVLVLTASPKSYQAAVDLTAATLKCADGNLGRATAFMNFQKRGLVPKERNILMSAPRITDPVRVEAVKTLPVGESESWEEALAASVRFVWLDDPVASVREAMHAFALAPYDVKSLQLCADAVMKPILAITRDPESVKTVVEFLTYGENGVDGKKGTADDLRYPLEELTPVLTPGKEE